MFLQFADDVDWVRHADGSCTIEGAAWKLRGYYLEKADTKSRYMIYLQGSTIKLADIPKRIFQAVNRGYHIEVNSSYGSLTHPLGCLVTWTKTAPNQDVLDYLDRLSTEVQHYGVGPDGLVDILVFRGDSDPTPLRMVKHTSSYLSIMWNGTTRPLELLDWKDVLSNVASMEDHPSSMGNDVMELVYENKDLPTSEFIELMIDHGYEDLL